tara:strand:- start:1382 stop:3310 length:1929 start_codon:yes stop_codon:yes gene_type:complete
MSTTTNKKRLKVTELDFDAIKENLKIYLKSQNEFKDYDFDGSGFSILLDTLAYNTHYLGYNANMLANEMFLDSASLRSSIVSHAKTMGYEVSSARAANATISISIKTSAATISMPAGTKFASTLNGATYNFVTVADLVGAKFGNSVNFDSIGVYEGTYVETRYTADTSDLEQRFLLRDNRADTSTLTVKVINSASDSTTTTYTKATDITQLTSTSTVYFLQEVEAGKFEVYFGDGIVSKAIEDGNIVSLSYVVTNKTEANGAALFSPPSSIAGESDITVSTIMRATGGAEPESLSSIKLSAPLNYASQGRCVTTSDYETYVKKLFANTQAVNVFGGEDGSYDASTGVSSTPEYGKVFISIKSTTGADLTSTQKSQLVNDLKKYTVASITPQVVDPETTYLRLTTAAKYDSSATTKSASDIATLITSALTSYNTNNLQTFNSQYRASAVGRTIDEAHTSILNNTTTLKLSKFFTPTTGTTTSYNLSFNNALYHPEDGYLASTGGILTSSGFKVGTDTTSEFFFDEDGAGNIRRYSLVGTTRSYADSQAGTIDYTSGVIKINNINITAISNVDDATSTQIRIIVTPNTNDIVPVRNQILEIDFTNTTVTASADTESSSGSSYSTSGSGSSATTTVSTSGGTSSY